MAKFVFLFLAVLTALVAWWFWPQAVPAQAVRVQRTAFRQVLDEDGLVRSQVEVALASQLQGRLVRLRCQRGERVAVGRVLAQLDSQEGQANLAQMVAQERAARSALEQAQQQRNLQEARSVAEVGLAQAGVALASAQQRKVESGPRAEQRAALQAIYQRARLRLEESQRDLQRRRELFQQGAVSRSDLESFEVNERNARFALREAQSRWQEARRGPVREERQQALAEVERSRASLEVSQAQQGSVAVAEAAAEEAQARLESLQAQVAQAQVRLEQLKLIAPVAGVVEWQDLEVGQMVSPGQTLMRISEPRRLYVELLLDEGDRAQVRPGLPVRVLSDAYPELTFSGRVQAIEAQAFLKRELRNSPTQDEDRVFRARVTLEDQAAVGKLFPGMSVFAQVVLAERAGVMTVARQACINREGQWLVFRLQGERAQRQVIEVGQRDNTQVEVVKGLKEGDQVLLNPGSLQDGQRVQVAPAGKSP